jgi:hypothetical protein
MRLTVAAAAPASLFPRGTHPTTQLISAPSAAQRSWICSSARRGNQHGSLKEIVRQLHCPSVLLRASGQIQVVNEDVDSIKRDDDGLPSCRVDKEVKLDGSFLLRGQGPWSHKNATAKSGKPAGGEGARHPARLPSIGRGTPSGHRERPSNHLGPIHLHWRRRGPPLKRHTHGNQKSQRSNPQYA